MKYTINELANSKRVSQPVREALLQMEAELEATNRQVEILSDALAESRREIAALKAVQEPVWIQPDHLQKAQKAPFLCRVEPHKRDDFVPLYPTPPAAQRQWMGLTDEEVDAAIKSNWGEMKGGPLVLNRTYVRVIEAKLKEKNT
jgi:hypothetical protein